MINNADKNGTIYAPYTDVISYYDSNAAALSQQYESLVFEEVHKDIANFLPSPGRRAVDIGAGSGRDAAALCKLGFDVTAVEPSREMRERGAHLHAEDNITWIDDTLPHLRRIDRHLQFDLVLVSAVWMHLDRQDQRRAMQTIYELTAPGGRAFISFRSKGPHDKAIIHPTTVEAVREDAIQCGYRLLNRSTSEDRLGRSDIMWHSLIFEKQRD